MSSIQPIRSYPNSLLIQLLLPIFISISISILLSMPLFYIALREALSLYDIVIKTVIFSVGILGLQQILSFVAIKNLKIALTIGIVSLIIFFVTVWIEAGLIHFTGEKFSPAFFYHLNWQSSYIAFNMYKSFAIYLLLSILLSILILKRYLEFEKDRAINWHQNNIIKYKIVIYLVFITLSLPNTPIWGFCRGAIQYYFDQNSLITVTSNDKKVLSDIGVRVISNGKSDIVATPPKEPQNLILIFLESINFEFMNNPNFPELTPTLNRYSKRFTLLTNHISTENATLPAIISNLCGIIPDYSMGNDTLTTENAIYKNLACFTDILKSAGYYQVYMGGAESSFAGKQDFLSQHGYHEIIGWEYWKNKDNYKDDNSHSYWGLYDSDLFKEAVNKMEELKSLSPFNLTLLTLNTHLPGFFSNSCLGYLNDGVNSTNSDMLNAIYCSDAAVGKYLDWLEANGFFENTTIVVVGDHQMFNHEITRSILGDNIDDQRIFGMIHSPEEDGIPKNIDSKTAPYDMASTILNLLSIDHNIEFSIGQSIFEPISSDRIIVDRDFQISDQECDPSTISLPFDANSFSSCEYKRLLSIMDRNISRFSREEPSIMEKLEHVIVRSSIKYDITPSIFLDDMEQLEYISKDGFRRELTSEGLYCLILASDGKVKLREFYDVNNPFDMDNFLKLFEDMTLGDWFFMVHKGDIIEKIPTSAAYILKNMGWHAPVGSLKGHSSIFISREGAAPNSAIVINSSESNGIEKELLLDDFKGLMPLFSPHDKKSTKKDELWSNSTFLSMVVDDGKLLSRNIEANVNICGFGGGNSLFSFFSKPIELQRGLNLLVFSRSWELVANLNYDFYNSDINVDELVHALKSDTSKLDMTVVVAVHDDAKVYFPDSVKDALKDRGADKIGDLEYRSPYLFIFHTKYGAIYESLGKSGECIVEDEERAKIIKRVLTFQED
ncbi:MAG: sulfatase-like hydrolase/transferase [Desulfamplus sp.]|nr:sulfatase-like hydrolase/transferase [Desulfamplus sp.]